MTSQRAKRPKSGSHASGPQPFVDHLQELRRRSYIIALAILFWGTATYMVQMQVVDILLRPSHGQHFIYTTPGGGLDFLFRICIYSGLILSTPIIVYQLLGFMRPLMSEMSRRFIIVSSMVSSFLAFAGIAFGYLIGLPSALHFLLHQFTTAQIKPLVTVQSYLSFVIAYMLGSALLFQLPMILLWINRIKPLKPSRLFHYERWVILAAFILAFLMNPTPNLLSQMIVAGPFIIMYHVGILLIAIVNRSQSAEAVAVDPQPQPLPSISVAHTRPLARYMIRHSLRSNARPHPSARPGVISDFVAPKSNFMVRPQPS